MLRAAVDGERRMEQVAREESVLHAVYEGFQEGYARRDDGYVHLKLGRYRVLKAVVCRVWRGAAGA